MHLPKTLFFTLIHLPSPPLSSLCFPHVGLNSLLHFCCFWSPPPLRALSLLSLLSSLSSSLFLSTLSSRRTRAPTVVILPSKTETEHHAIAVQRCTFLNSGKHSRIIMFQTFTNQCRNRATWRPLLLEPTGIVTGTARSDASTASQPTKQPNNQPTNQPGSHVTELRLYFLALNTHKKQLLF